MIILKYIYYKLYKLAIKSEKQWGANIRMPQLVAFFSLSILLSINFLTFIIFLKHGFNFIDLPELTSFHAIVTVIGIYFLNYIFFIRKRNYLKIEEHFDKLFKVKNKFYWDAFFWLYVVMTFPVLILVLEIFVSTR